MSNLLYGKFCFVIQYLVMPIVNSTNQKIVNWKNLDVALRAYRRAGKSFSSQHSRFVIGRQKDSPDHVDFATAGIRDSWFNISYLTQGARYVRNRWRGQQSSLHWWRTTSLVMHSIKASKRATVDADGHSDTLRLTQSWIVNRESRMGPNR